MSNGTNDNVNRECPVCYEQIDLTESALTCSHIVHHRCIRRSHQDRCPICRHSPTGVENVYEIPITIDGIEIGDLIPFREFINTYLYINSIRTSISVFNSIHRIRDPCIIRAYQAFIRDEYEKLEDRYNELTVEIDAETEISERLARRNT